MDNPTVFISYSHDNDEHKSWVLKLASDLRRHGVDAILDQWDLHIGNDLRFFMENGLSSSKLVLCICSENYVQKVNCYEYADYTEREVIMKTADGGTDYYNDTEFLYKCFLWAGISQRNKSLSRIGLINEFCFGQDTRSDSILKGYTLDTADKNLYDTWIEVLNLAKNTEEYNCAWNYGLSQICTDINIKVGSGTFNKTGKEIEIPKYRILDEKVNELKRLLKKYYQSEIKHKLFKYKLLK